MSQEEQHLVETNANVDGAQPSTLNDMFTLLLDCEIKTLKGAAPRNEGCSLSGEVTEVERDEGEAVRDAIDDERWLTEEIEAQSKSEQEEDQLSLDTRVKNMIQSQQTTSTPDLLTSIAQDLAIEEKTGQAVNAELAAILSSLLKARLADDKLQEKLKKYPRPANVECLKTPRVNPLIWGQISATARASDAKSQKIQYVLIAAVSAMVTATEYVLNKGGDQELLPMLTDSIAFMLQCNHEHNHSRRLAMKQDLHKDFAALCNVHVPCGDFLFGDLSKATKDITDANKLAKKVRPAAKSQASTRGNRGYSSYGQPSRSQRRYQPYQRSRNNFFEKGRFPTTRKRGNTSK